MKVEADCKNVRRLYTVEGLSRDRIALILGVPHSAVTNTLRRLGIRIRPPRTPITIAELTLTRPSPPRIELVGAKSLVRHQVKLTMRLAYVIGWVVGDGYVNSREVDAIVSLRERKYVELVIKSFLNEFGRLLVVRRHRVHIIRCNSTRLARLLCTKAGRWYWQNIDFILRYRRFAAAFIAGFWDADGGVFHESNGAFRAHLYNSNLIRLRKVKAALAIHFGIQATIYMRKRNKRYPGSKIHQRLERFDLYVRAKSNAAWKEEVARHILIPWKRPEYSGIR